MPLVSAGIANHRGAVALMLLAVTTITVVVPNGMGGEAPRGPPALTAARPPAAEPAVLAAIEPDLESAVNRLFRRLYAAGNASLPNATEANTTVVPVWTTFAPDNVTNATTTAVPPSETPMIDETAAPPGWWWPNTTVAPGNWSNATGAPNVTFAPNVTLAPNVTFTPNVTLAPNVTNTSAPNVTFTPNTTFAPTTTTAPSTNETAAIDIVCRRSGNTWTFSSPLLEVGDDVTITGYVIDITAHNTVAAVQRVVDEVCHDLVWVPLTPMPTNASNVTNGTQPPGNFTNGTETVDWILWCREGVVNFTNGSLSGPQWNATSNGTWNESRWQQGAAPVLPSSFVPGTSVRWHELPWWPRFLAWNSSFPVPITIGVNASRWSSESELERLVHFVCGGGPATRNPGTIAPTLPPATVTPPPATVPDRSAILPWFLLPEVLARTPIFTVGTFVPDNSLIDALGFSRDLSRLLRERGLPQFTEADAPAVVQMTHCGVQRGSMFGTTPLDAAMCRGTARCNGDRVPCLPGIERCTCPAVSWYLPLNDTYVAPTETFRARQGVRSTLADAADAAVANSTALQGRRQADPTFVQLQFPLRLDMAESYLPATPQEIIDLLELALNETSDVLYHDNTFRDNWQVDRSFIFVRFAFDNLYGDTVRVPGTGSQPQLLWLLVLLVFPVAAMAYGIFRLVQYIRWRRYGSQLRVHMDAYDEDLGDEDPDAAAAAKGAMVAVAAGMGDGDWADGNAGRADPDEFFAVADATALEEFDLLETASGAGAGGCSADDDGGGCEPLEV